MYHLMGIGQCPPEATRPPKKDPCSVKYVVDLPVLGEEEVEVPLEQLSRDFMSSVTRRLPQHLPQIVADVQPYADQMKAGLIRDAKQLIHDTLERQVRPEIEAQKAVLINDINREANKVLVTMGLISIVIVGGVGLAAWYTVRKR